MRNIPKVGAAGSSGEPNEVRPLPVKEGICKREGMEIFEGISRFDGISLADSVRKFLGSKPAEDDSIELSMLEEGNDKPARV